MEPPIPPPSPASVGGSEGGDIEEKSPSRVAAAEAKKKELKQQQQLEARDEKTADAIRLLTKRNQALQTELDEEKAEVKRRQVAFHFSRPPPV